MIYSLMEPPFDFNSYKEMSKKEAKKYFDWYISEIPSRIQLLRDAFEFTGGGSKELLNLTPESLKLIWAWFLPRIELTPKSHEEIEAELEKIPEWLKRSITPDTHRLTIETLAVAMDISIYFAEVFLKEHDSLRWDLITKPKSFYSVNRPILLGFKNKMDMDSRLIIRNLTLEASEGNNNQNALYDLYNVWLEFI